MSMIDDIVSHITNIPHGEKRGAEVSLFHGRGGERYVREGIVVGNSSKEHLDAYHKVLGITENVHFLLRTDRLYTHIYIYI